MHPPRLNGEPVICPRRQLRPRWWQTTGASSARTWIRPDPSLLDPHSDTARMFVRAIIIRIVVVEVCDRYSPADNRARQNRHRARGYWSLTFRRWARVPGVAGPLILCYSNTKAVAVSLLRSANQVLKEALGIASRRITATTVRPCNRSFAAQESVEQNSASLFPFGWARRTSVTPSPPPSGSLVNLLSLAVTLGLDSSVPRGRLHSDPTRRIRRWWTRAERRCDPQTSRRSARGS